MSYSLTQKFSLVCALVLCPVLAQASMLTQGDIIQLRRYSSGAYETYGAASGGGEFAIFKKVGTTYEFLAKTFCLEYYEHIRLNRDFLVGGVSDRAVLGGKNITTGDELSAAVDFLYSAFYTGTLKNYDVQDYLLNPTGPAVYYDPTSDTWANALQRAIWKLEDEKGLGNYSYSDEATLLHKFALAQESTWSGSNVRALNLFDVGTDLTGFDPLDPTSYIDDAKGRTRETHKQDQLWYVSGAGTGGPGGPGPNPVPEPATLLIWSAFGLGGFVSSRRRRQSTTTTAKS